MQLGLLELQESYPKAKKLRSKNLLKGWEVMEGILEHQGFLYILEIICSEVIYYLYDNLLAGHFRIDKTTKLIAKNYF